MAEFLSDPAAERAVLAAIFSHGYAAYADVADLLTADSFTDVAAQATYVCLEHLLKANPQGRPDEASVFSAAQSKKLDGLMGGPEGVRYLRAVRNFPIMAENARAMAAKVKKLDVARSLDRRIQAAQRDLREITGDEPVEEILARVEGPVMDFAASLDASQSGAKPMGAGARAYLQGLMDNPREMAGIPTGFPRYDRAIGGGIRPNSVDVIGARLKQGKSFLVDSVGLHVAGKLGLPAFNVDTEMTQEEHLHRVCAALAGIPVTIEEIETGRAGARPDARDAVLAAADRLAGMPYDYESVNCKGSDAILASMRRWLFTRVGFDQNGYANPCVIIYDYLKLTTSTDLSKNLAEYQALGFIMTALKSMMGRYRAGCLAFVQLNRDGMDKDDTSVIAQSDRIGWLCTSFSTYRRMSAEEKAEQPVGCGYTHRLVPVATRHGPDWPDGDYINMKALYQYGRVEEGPTRSELRQRGAQQPQGFEVDGPPDEQQAF